jgi:hypothetical protein
VNRDTGRNLDHFDLGLFTRCLGLDRQGMHAAFEFRLQKMIDNAVAVDPALASKGFRNHLDAKVGFSRAPCGSAPLDGVSVGRVFVGFVDDFDRGGGQGLL